MIGYVTLGTKDLQKAAAFYDKIAAEMGIGRFMESECQLRSDCCDDRAGPREPDELDGWSDGER